MSELNTSFRDQFASGPSFFPHMLDVPQDRVLIARMSEKDFREASFLDQRVLTPDRPCEWLPWDSLSEIGIARESDAGMIFHIGHVGSTLISRLLGELPQFLGVREPLVLRTLAELSPLLDRPEHPWEPGAFQVRLQKCMEWLSRTFAPGQRAIVKATSFASEIADPILHGGRPALFMYVDARTYLETILAGPASTQELHALSAQRLTRLHARLGVEAWQLWRLSTGERAALAWACEMTALQDAAARSVQGSVLWLHFDEFLAKPGEWIECAAAHFGAPVDGAAAAALAQSPIMTRYSKAPEHGYSADLRRAVLEGARVEHAEELRRGTMWIEAAARDHPPIVRALEGAPRGGALCSG